jgi:hypothetical protein
MTITSVRRFIVRIYRATRNRPDRVFGVLEDVNKGEEWLFRNKDDLWTLLNARGRRIKKTNRKGGEEANKRGHCESEEP